MKGGTAMNAHERGKKLSKIVTGTIGLLAIVAASALGLHDWADSLATQDASATTTSTTTTGNSGTTSGSTTTQATEAPAAPAAPRVSSGNGTKVHAKTSGS
ncbi:hypothetical protein KIV56_16365 [Cryobacterium breve]|jgi:hypothetical protein|uniref:Uncharacterized protein n=1 Tax=Cryobacterium breve TaxID=1259258 RepID=A0ABY7NB71_9MICO|nr:hypothetical protein [Cryobacterium breve]WBM79757.1 hypothetical protein KIV56_16365 [Cryobacterium breve]